MKLFKDPALKRLEKARTQVLLAHPFFGSLLLRQQLALDENVTDMVTDGVTLRVNPEYAKSAPMAELKGVFAHNALHPALLHHERMGKRDPKLWNEACDYVINPIVRNAGLTLPDNALFRDEFEGETAEHCYQILLQERPPQGGQGPQKDDGEQGQGDGQGGQSNQGEGQDGGQDDDQGDQQDQSDQGQGQDQQGQGQQPSPSYGGTGSFEAPPPEADTDWEVSLQQAKNLEQAKAGDGPGTIAGDIDRLIKQTLSPEEDWREILRQYMTDCAQQDYTWTRPNRRFIHQNLYLPSLHSEGMGPLAFVIDASGSMPTKALEKAASEFAGVAEDLKPEFIDVYVHDSELVDTRRFYPGEKADYTAYSGGGTDICSTIDALNNAGENYACVVWFTDLEFYSENWEHEPVQFPVVWIDHCQAERYQAQVRFGEIVNIEL